MTKKVAKGIELNYDVFMILGTIAWTIGMGVQAYLS